MLCVVVFLYGSSVALWAMNIWVGVTTIHSLLMVPNVTLLDRPHLASESIVKTTPPHEVLFMFNMIVADSVVIWRTWAVHQGRILATLPPCLLLLVSFVFGLMDIVCESDDDAAALLGAEVICNDAAFISWVFSVATNITCTILIGLKAWQHRRVMRELDSPLKGRKMSSEKILSILVESGFIYSLLWLSQVVDFLNVLSTSSAVYFWTVIRAMSNQMTGMYPTLIIVIVNLRYTIWDEESSPAISDHWVVNTNPSGITDTFGTQRGGDTVHLRSVVDITHDIGDASVKHSTPSSEEYAV
ncbi:hypothetical protein C8R45DRAFT_1125716 [Mycena sanguinolenta]|nr:hypothetical protein C8R45DRAFT_1125716 [Mycena sanguinolenta]